MYANQEARNRSRRTDYRGRQEAAGRVETKGKGNSETVKPKHV